MEPRVDDDIALGLDEEEDDLYEPDEMWGDIFDD